MTMIPPEAMQEVNYYREQGNESAQAMWFWFVVIGVVWYFASWQWALIPTAASVWMAFSGYLNFAKANRIIARYEV